MHELIQLSDQTCYINLYSPTSGSKERKTYKHINTVLLEKETPQFKLHKLNRGLQIRQI